MAQEVSDNYTPRHRKKLFFNHIPKTAGTTVSNYLGRFYSVDETIRGWQFFYHLKHYVGSSANTGSARNEPVIPEVMQKIEAALDGEKPASLQEVPYDRLFKDFYLIVYGHKNYRSVLPREWKTMTFLREPLDRLISQHIEEGHTLEERLARRDYLSSEIKRNLLASKESLAGKLKACNADGAQEDLYWNVMTTNLVKNFFVSNHDDPRQLPPECILETAMQKLDEMFFIGLRERFSESMAILQYKMGWPYEPQIRSANVRHSSDMAEGLSADDRKLVERSIALDREVYSRGTRLFEAQLQQVLEEGSREFGMDFSDRLADLVDLNYMKNRGNDCRKRNNENGPIVRTLEMRDSLVGTGWHERMICRDHVYRWTGPASISTVDLFLRKSQRYKVSVFVIRSEFSSCYHEEIDSYWERVSARLNGKSGRLLSDGVAGDIAVARAQFDEVPSEEDGFVRLELNPLFSSMGRSQERGKRDNYQRGLPICRIEFECLP